MKKIIALALLITGAICFSAFAVASVVIPATAFDVNQKPSNIQVIKLGTCNSGPLDSFAAIGGAPKVYGPFALSIDPTRPQFKGFQAVAASAAFSSGDTLKLEYQLLPTNKVSDTTSTWTAVAAVWLTGTKTGYIDISALPGQSIVFKLTNIDETAAIIANPLRVIFLEPATVSVDSKR